MVVVVFRSSASNGCCSCSARAVATMRVVINRDNKCIAGGKVDLMSVFI